MRVKPDPRDGGPGDDQGGGNGSDPIGINDPSPAGVDQQPSSMAQQGRPLPILYGTRKIVVWIIEKFVATLAKPPDWLSTTPYYIGDYLSAGGNAYLVTVPGTSPSTFPNPPPTDADYHWGTDIHLKYIQALPMQVYQHHFLGALCEGAADGIKILWWDKEIVGTGALVAEIRGLKVLGGPDAANQVAASPFDSGTSYQHTALLYPKNEPTTGVFTGTKAELPATAVEGQALLFGAAGPDVSPADIVNDMLTHTRRGCSWPGSRVDTSITGAGAATFRTYCDAAGFRFSPYLDTQRIALDILSEILAATNSDAIWGGGKLKIIPLGDQSITTPVFGAVNYVPANTAQYNLTSDDFLDNPGPVQVQRRSDADCFNSIPVQFVERGSTARYQTVTVEDPDMTDVETRPGLKRGGTLALSFCFPDGTAPIQLSRILAQRSLNVRNTYTFRVSWRYVLTEPTDVVTVNLIDPVLGTMLSTRAVRIIEWEENEDGTITCIAEDYPAGVAAAAAYAPQTMGGYKANDKATAAIIPMTVDSVATSIAPGALINAGLSYANFDNLWPNPGAENAPPAGVVTLNNGTSAEWDYRTDLSTTTTQSGTLSGTPQTITVVSTANIPASGTLSVQLSTAGTWAVLTYTGKTSGSLTGCTGSGAFSNGAIVTSAYAGRWVRQFSDSDVSPSLIFPCSVGNVFYASAYLRRVSGSGFAGVRIHLLDVTGAVLGGAYVSPGGTPANWNLVENSTGNIWPDVVSVRIRFEIDASTVYQFDAIYVRRTTDLRLIAPGIADGQVIGLVGGVPTWVGPGLPDTRIAPTYGTTVTINASLGNEFVITATNGTAFTVSNPTNPPTGTLVGERITIRIRNTSGGALGAVTWGTAYKLAAWTSPATANSRSIDFAYDGTNWIEVSRTPNDVPN